jgi:hypothetical protein
VKDKSWHDKHIKNKIFKEGDIVLLYDRRYIQHPKKFKMHWLGLYHVEAITNGGAMPLKDLAGRNILGRVNGS